MTGFMAAFHQLGTLVFALGSVFVAARLLWLHRKSGQKPELFLGVAIGASVLGYGVMTIGMTVRGDDLLAPATALTAALQGGGMAIHNLGVTASLLFVLSVFRNDERWAWGLFGVLMAGLWGGWAGTWWLGGFRENVVGHPVWFLEHGVVWVYPLWSTVESFRYWAMMRKRQALGMADPLVVNRFLVWGFASLAMAVTIWVASITYAIMHDAALLAAWTPVIRVATAALGLITVSCYGITFFPPERYAAWVRRAEAASTAS